MIEGQRCENCRFWDDAEPEEPPSPEEIVPGLMSKPKKPGYCLRYPPTPTPQEGRVAVPVTDFEDWCGEWKGKEYKAETAGPNQVPAVVESVPSLEDVGRRLAYHLQEASLCRRLLTVAREAAKWEENRKKWDNT